MSDAAAPVVVPDDVSSFDPRGMPLTVASAQAMAPVAIESALVESVAKLKHISAARLRARTASAADGSLSLDSQVVMWLIAEFSKPFGRFVIDLSAVPDRMQWSSVASLAARLKEHTE